MEIGNDPDTSGGEVLAEYSRQGYPYSCTCGECHKTERGAWNCRKCREYLTEEDYEYRTVFYTYPDGSWRTCDR